MQYITKPTDTGIKTKLNNYKKSDGQGEQYSKHCMTDLHSLASSLSQYLQSAALPDMVPSR